MANNFELTISGLDGANDAIRSITVSIGQLLQPLNSVGKVANEVIGSLSNVTNNSLVKALVSATTGWAKLGSEIAQSAASIGISTTSLQSLRAAGAALGIDSKELTKDLQTLGITLDDALHGRNEKAKATLDQLGIGIRQTKSGSVDAAQSFRDLSAAIASTNDAQAQQRIASAFGLESALPLLREGPEAIAAYERQAASLGGVLSGESVVAAESFQRSLNLLGIAADGVKNAIGARLIPVIQPLIEQTTGLVGANQDLIATNVVLFVQSLADLLERLDFKQVSGDVGELIGVIDRVTGVLDNVRNALELGSLIVETFSTGLKLVTSVIPILSGILGGLSEVFLTVGSAIAATPIGWLIAGIATVAFGVYAIYANWDQIVQYFSDKIDSVRAAFDDGWTNGIMKLLEEFDPVTIVGDAINGLIQWLFGIDLSVAGEKLVSSLASGIKKLGSYLPESVQKLLGIDKIGAGKSPVPPVLTTVPGKDGGAAGGVGQSVDRLQRQPKAATAVTRTTKAVTRTTTAVTKTTKAVSRSSSAVSKSTSRVARSSRAVSRVSKAANRTNRTAAGASGAVARSARAVTRSTKAVSKSSKAVASTSKTVASTSTSTTVKTTTRRTTRREPLISDKRKAEANKKRRGSKERDDDAEEQEDTQDRSGENSGGTDSSQTPGADGSDGNNGNNGTNGNNGAQKVDIALTLYGLPAGVTATAQSGDGSSVPVRVAYSMPTGISP